MRPPYIKHLIAALALSGLVYLVRACLLVAAEPQSVPLEFTSQGSIFVEAGVGDTIKAKFVLDTGAGSHILARRLLDKVESHTSGVWTSFSLDGAREDRPMYEIPSLSVGGNLQIDPAVVTMSVLDSTDVKGVLSAEFFRYRVVTLDFRKKYIVFEDSASLRRRLAEGLLVPIKTRDDRGRSLEIFFDVTAGGGQTLECRFDTGSPTTFDERFLHGLKVMDKRNWMGIDEKGGKVMAWSGKLDFIALAYAPSVGLDQAGVAFMKNMIYDGVIGWNFFTDRCVTFNIPEKYAIIGKR